MIYFDNNSTTMMSPKTVQAMVEWTNVGNPSSNYKSAERCRQLMFDLRNEIGRVAGIKTCCLEKRDEGTRRNPSDDFYYVIFTSGATECNTTVIRGCAEAYDKHVDKVPHIISSEIEHKSILLLLESLAEHGRITYSLVAPRSDCRIWPEDVEVQLQKYPNTCLLTIMHANNETGAVSDIEKIAALSHKYNVPIYSDTVQSFGKYRSSCFKSLDGFCVAFHKIHGPPGVGALVIKKKFFHGYQLPPLLCGTQNSGFRGGTENMPALGASLNAIREMQSHLEASVLHTKKLKGQLLALLAQKYNIRKYESYVREPKSQFKREIIIFDHGDERSLTNTLYLSILTYTPPYICNVKLLKALEDKSIIISIGSACNSASKKASHVLYALKADEFIKRGAIRISLSATNTEKEVASFASTLISLVETLK